MSGRSILVVAAHADDEALGCGGSIARHAAEGDVVRVLFLADGVSSRDAGGDAQAQRRLAAAQQAAEILGVRAQRFLALPDNRLDTVALLDVVRPLEAAIAEWRPEVIYTHHHGDLNVDHRVAHQAVLTACRPQPGACVRTVLAFETVSSTEWSAHDLRPFAPTWFVDISAFLDIKLRALAAYAEEMRAAPHARSMEGLRHLAHHRGHSVGMAAAEAFMPVRILR